MFNRGDVDGVLMAFIKEQTSVNFFVIDDKGNHIYSNNAFNETVDNTTQKCYPMINIIRKH